MDGNQIRGVTNAGHGRMWRALSSSVVFAILSCVAVASAQPVQPKPAVPPALSRATESLPMTKFARERGFVRCAGALELAERNLLGASDYSFRAYPLTVPRTAAPNESTMFTAIVDARKRNPNEAAPRATFNITVLVSQQVPNACTTIYEQTIYHMGTCDAVVAQMAPNGKQSPNPSYGSVLLDVSDNLSLTLIPIGAAHCITVVKEAAMDVPNPASFGARR